MTTETLQFQGQPNFVHETTTQSQTSTSSPAITTSLVAIVMMPFVLIKYVGSFLFYLPWNIYRTVAHYMHTSKAIQKVDKETQIDPPPSCTAVATPDIDTIMACTQAISKYFDKAQLQNSLTEINRLITNRSAEYSKLAGYLISDKTESTAEFKEPICSILGVLLHSNFISQQQRDILASLFLLMLTRSMMSLHHTSVVKLEEYTPIATKSNTEYISYLERHNKLISTHSSTSTEFPPYFNIKRYDIFLESTMDVLCSRDAYNTSHECVQTLQQTITKTTSRLEFINNICKAENKSNVTSLLLNSSRLAEDALMLHKNFYESISQKPTHGEGSIVYYLMRGTYSPSQGKVTELLQQLVNESVPKRTPVTKELILSLIQKQYVEESISLRTLMFKLDDISQYTQLTEELQHMFEQRGPAPSANTTLTLGHTQSQMLRIAIASICNHSCENV